jgi:thymidylate synthase
MNKFENDYSNLIKLCCKKGSKIVGRNGRIRQMTGAQIRANLQDGFPIVTGKRIFPKSIFIELEWMLKGLTNTRWLNDRGVKIWDEWADNNGDLGPVYGHQILSFNGVNQIEYLKKEMGKLNSRRLLVSMWNPNDLSKMQLPPCHYSFQFVIDKEFVDIVVSMRSLDLFIGLPYDMGMYATMLSAFANEFNLIAREVVINAANAHIYEEHIGAAAVYANREKLSLPTLKSVSIFSKFDHLQVQLDNYNFKERIIVTVKK